MKRNYAAFAVAICLVAGCDAFKAPTKKVVAGAAPVVKEEAAPEMERVKAEVGVGKKGASLRGDGANQIIAGPAVAFFNSKEKIVFTIEVPHALNLFWGEHGNYPKSHEEFMEKIIDFNMIKLPLLPEGAKYVYDPETHTLMVERPAKSAAPQ
jgi:hypothetical protein